MWMCCRTTQSRTNIGIVFLFLSLSISFFSISISSRYVFYFSSWGERQLLGMNDEDSLGNNCESPVRLLPCSCGECLWLVESVVNLFLSSIFGIFQLSFLWTLAALDDIFFFFFLREPQNNRRQFNFELSLFLTLLSFPIFVQSFFHKSQMFSFLPFSLASSSRDLSNSGSCSTITILSYLLNPLFFWSFFGVSKFNAKKVKRQMNFVWKFEEGTILEVKMWREPTKVEICTFCFVMVKQCWHVLCNVIFTLSLL